MVNECDRETSLAEAMTQNRVEMPEEKITTTIFRVRYILLYLILGKYDPPKRRHPQSNTSGHIINDHSINYDLQFHLYYPWIGILFATR